MQDFEGKATNQGNGDGKAKAEASGKETSADQAEILHGLNNVLVSILLNAQLMEWKLPSYSHLRRNVHEIERSAQRAGILLKRLLAERGARKARDTWVAHERT